MISPNEILDRQETCSTLHISRQTLISWIRKGKLKVWKRVGTGSNAALLFERTHVESLAGVRSINSGDPMPPTAEITHDQEAA